MPPKTAQLISAIRLLKEARGLVADAKQVLGAMGNRDAAMRLKNIGEEILNELEYLHRLIAKEQ